MKKNNLTKWSVKAGVALLVTYLLFATYMKVNEAEKEAREAKKYYDLHLQEKEKTDQLQLELENCMKAKKED